MKKLIIILISIFVPLLIWSHQDKYFTYEYKNVTVRFKTGYFYEEIHNAKIIGEYAALLASNMDYDNPILLDFIHDYFYDYKGKNFSFLNIGSEEYSLLRIYKQEHDSISNNIVNNMIPFSEFTVINSPKVMDKDIEKIPRINRKKKIVIRQFGYHFDIAHTLNILHYAISNKALVSKASEDKLLFSCYTNLYYNLESIPRKIIDSVSQETSGNVNKVLENKVYREIDSIDHDQLYYSYYSKGNKYIIYAGIKNKEILLDTLNQVYSLNKVRHYFNNPLFVFETPNLIRQYSQIGLNEYEFQKYKQHEIPFDLYRQQRLKNIHVKWIGKDIYLITFNAPWVEPLCKMLYLKDDDVLISDFESYLNSFRNKEK